MEQEKTYKELVKMAYDLLQAVQHKNKAKEKYTQTLKYLKNIALENLEGYMNRLESEVNTFKELEAIYLDLSKHASNLPQHQLEILKELLDA